MSHSNYEYDEKRVHDAWGSWDELIDDRADDPAERPSMAEVTFEFAEVHVHKITCDTDQQTAEAILNGDMNEKTQEFLADHPDVWKGFAQVNKPSWVKDPHEAEDTKCFAVVIQDLEGGAA